MVAALGRAAQGGLRVTCRQLPGWLCHNTDSHGSRPATRILEDRAQESTFKQLLSDSLCKAEFENCFEDTPGFPCACSPLSKPIPQGRTAWWEWTQALAKQLLTNSVHWVRVLSVPPPQEATLELSDRNCIYKLFLLLLWNFLLFSSAWF